MIRDSACKQNALSYFCFLLQLWRRGNSWGLIETSPFGFIRCSIHWTKKWICSNLPMSKDVVNMIANLKQMWWRPYLLTFVSKYGLHHVYPLVNIIFDTYLLICKDEQIHFFMQWYEKHTEKLFWLQLTWTSEQPCALWNIFFLEAWILPIFSSTQWINTHFIITSLNLLECLIIS